MSNIVASVDMTTPSIVGRLEQLEQNVLAMVEIPI
jgi:hypothetical protein